MSPPDPPASALGALDTNTLRRLRAIPRCDPFARPDFWSAQDVTDLRALLAAYDAQAARLAAVEGERDHAIANLVQAHDRWGAEEQRVTRQAARLAALREWAVAERDEWSGRNADRYWQMTRVVNEIDGAVGAGEEDGCAQS